MTRRAAQRFWPSRTLRIDPPKPSELRIRNRVSGINFIDCYQRSGLYPIPLPGTPGCEGVGIVEACGDQTTGFKVGDRVVYFVAGGGSYSEHLNVGSDYAYVLPDSISDDTAACLIIKGLTAWYLLYRSYPVKTNDTVLIYAAAGGVGLILTQWAKLLGANVIGIVGTEAKAKLARAAGADEIILSDEDVVARVRALTNNKGVPVVYDSVGKDTFIASLDCLAPHGVMVSYGNASGAVEPFALSELASRGSLFVTRPRIFDFINDRQIYESAMEELIERIASGGIDISVNQRYELADAATAHRDLEARKTTGCSVLTVS